MTLRKIRFRQTGGFAGLVRGCELAPGALDAKERQELERLLRDSGLAENSGGKPVIPSGGANRGRARDLVQYEIEIESDAAVARYSLDDLDLSEKIAPLVAFLQKCARPMPLDRGKS